MTSSLASYFLWGSSSSFHSLCLQSKMFLPVQSPKAHTSHTVIQIHKFLHWRKGPQPINYKCTSLPRVPFKLLNLLAFTIYFTLQPFRSTCLLIFYFHFSVQALCLSSLLFSISLSIENWLFKLSYSTSYYHHSHWVPLWHHCWPHRSWAGTKTDQTSNGIDKVDWHHSAVSPRKCYGVCAVESWK